MKECEICWSDKEHFFDLECCPHDICKDCIEQIRTPSCPFCRSHLPILSIGRRNSIFYNPPETLHENYFLWSSMDDLYLYSRWYRRQRRRTERLRQREEHDHSNRERNRRYNLRREIRQEVNEYLENRHQQQNTDHVSDNSSSNSAQHSNNAETEHVEESVETEQLSVSFKETSFPFLNQETLEGVSEKKTEKKINNY
jgi:hypothetical protein